MDPTGREHNGCVFGCTGFAFLFVAGVIFLIGCLVFATPPMSRLQNQWELRWAIFAFNGLLATILAYFGVRCLLPPPR